MTCKHKDIYKSTSNRGCLEVCLECGYYRTANWLVEGKLQPFSSWDTEYSSDDERKRKINLYTKWRDQETQVTQ